MLLLHQPDQRVATPKLCCAAGRTSIIIIILTGLILLGTLLTAVLGSLRAWEGIQHGTRAGFKPFCSV